MYCAFVKQPSPNILNDQIVVRCDRQTGNNKGGTIICVRSNMQPYHTCLFTSNGIEIACTTLTLPNASNIRIAVLYRSPSVPLQALVIMLSQFLVHLRSY